MANRVIDPNFFIDAIEEFAFDYDWYVEDKFVINDLGRKEVTYKKLTLHASLQSQGATLDFRSGAGSSTTHEYKFYCRSLYRIKIGDFINYQNKWLHVDFVQDYDEWGVREGKCSMINLNEYKDLKESIAALRGLNNL